jgi:hypothetical protein
MLRSVLRGLRALEHDGIERGFQQLVVAHTFAAPTTTANGPPSASTKRLRFTPFLPLSVGFEPMRSPQKTGLPHRSVSRLPLEVHSAKLFASLDQLLPDEIWDAKLDPPLEGAMHGGVIRKLFGHPVPLAAASHSEDDRVQGGALVYAGTPRFPWWVVLGEDRFDLLPQLVGCTRQMVGSGFSFSAIGVSSFAELLRSSPIIPKRRGF